MVSLARSDSPLPTILTQYATPNRIQLTLNKKLEPRARAISHFTSRTHIRLDGNGGVYFYCRYYRRPSVSWTLVPTSGVAGL
jgi:hypothetical protein